MSQSASCRWIGRSLLCRRSRTPTSFRRSPESFSGRKSRTQLFAIVAQCALLGAVLHLLFRSLIGAVGEPEISRGGSDVDRGNSSPVAGCLSVRLPVCTETSDFASNLCLCVKARFTPEFLALKRNSSNELNTTVSAAKQINAA